MNLFMYTVNVCLFFYLTSCLVRNVSGPRLISGETYIE